MDGGSQNMKHKRISTAAIMLAVPAFAGLLALPVFSNSAITVSADETEEYFALGDADDFTPYVGKPAEDDNSLKPQKSRGDRAAALPSQIDLSDSPYFPPIGNQQGVGSCYAWSSTYYQYTYEANKLNGIASTAENAYSPAFIFNYLTSTDGYDGGGGVCTDAYDFLMEHGALHMSEMPYQAANGSTSINRYNYDYSLSTDTDAMIAALHTRVSGHNAVSIPGTGTPITGPNCEALNEVKQLLANGKMLSIRVDGFRDWEYGDRKIYDEATGTVSTVMRTATEPEYVCYRSVSNGTGHAMTVVGYDDSVWVDINGNNQVEEAELGAFKVANSHGTTYRNGGFTWVAYDALNQVTAVPGNWEAGLPEGRIAIFDRHPLVSVNGEYDVNGFYYITVENKDVYYVGQLTVNTDDAVGLYIYLNRRAPYTDRKIQGYYIDNEANISFDGTLAFDYANFADPIGSYLSGYNWGIELYGSYNSASFRITDDLSNTIVDMGAISGHEITGPISIVEGDLNYDGRCTQADFDIAASGVTLSTLQEYLAQHMQDKPDPESDLVITSEVLTSWNNGQVINVTVKNNGTTPVNGWALRAENFGGEIVSIWNASLYSGNIVRCASYNATIPVGGEVTFGYQIANPTGTDPVFTPISGREDFTNTTEILTNIVNEWNDGFVAFLTIENNSDETLTAWELTVSTEGCTINNAGSLNVVENGDGTYTISGANENYEIAAHSSITFQIICTKTGTPVITLVSMTAAA